MFWRRICAAALILIIIAGYTVPTNTVFAAINIQSFKNAVNDGNSLTIENPGTSGNELLLAQITFNKPNQVGSGTEITPSGWTLLSLVKNLSNSLGQAVFYKVTSTDEPPSYTWSFNVGVKSTGVIIIYTGVDTTNPIVDSDDAFSFNNPMTAPGIDAEANSMLVVFYGIADNSTVSGPDGMNDIYAYQNPEISIHGKYQTVTAGTTGNKTANAAPPSYWIVHAVTLRPTTLTYTLTYMPGPNGSITGTSPQTVYYGDSGSAVTAVPDTDYHFVDWSDGSSANPRTDTNVQANINVTANFAPNAVTYTLTYTAGANGTISGTSPQIVNQGANGGAVTAVPNTGYHFVDWSDSSTMNPRTDTNVQADISVTANFAINIYTLTYTAGTNGTISGTSPQTVNHGAGGSAVTAVPNTGYHFVDWSDSSTMNPRTDTNVTANINVTANFAQDTTVTFTLTYAAGANGSITGTSPQIVNQGANGSAVTAVSNTGYHFVDWSDSSTVNPRTDSNVQANISVTANFAINTYTLVYAAGEHGSISGTTPQTVNYGDDGSAVTAVPDTGYHFVGWSDSSTANPRTDTDVKANINVTANFAINKYTLTVSSEGSGSINKSPNQANYDHGTIVQLTAEPADGWNFSNWSGDLTGSNNPASITMTNNKTITAVFIENGYLLTISVVGSGSVSRTPDQVSYTGGSSVQLTAAPADGWTFDSWSGNITGSENPASILINGEITVTATFIQSNDNSGGFSGGFGGGGGSSGGGLAGPGITNLAVYTNSEGYFNIATIAQSEDGLVQLAIDKGVVAKDKEGQGLKAVSIKEATETPPPPAKAIFIGQVFDFGPDGATFTPPVPLTFSYDRDLLPQGLTDYSLSIVTRDAAAGSWVEIGGEVNQAAGTITVPVSHFSQYAVIAHTRPASFTIKSLTVSPAEANVGEEITVDVTTANTGDQPGEYTIVLKINGNTESTQKASIEGNASKLLSFKFTRDAPDTYEIDVNGQTATFTIMAPPGPAVLLLKSLAVNPYETTYGETINISVLAENTGSFALQDTLTLMIDGVVVDRREVDIAPYTAETITFSMANIEPGSRTIDINGQQTNFIVKPLLSPKVKAAINWYLIGLLIFLLTATSSTVGFYLKIKPQEIPVVPPRIKK